MPRFIVYFLLSFIVNFNTLRATENVSLNCPLPKLKGFNPKEITDIDLQCLKKAKVRCGELYPNSPCLKVFQKTGEITYRAICGAAK